VTTQLPVSGTVEATAADSPRPRGLPTLLLVPIAAAAWWLVGFLPWVIDLLGSNILTANGYGRAALPLLSGSSVFELVISAGVGGVLAGLVGLLGRGRGWARTAAVVTGVVIVLALAVAQSRAALDGSQLGGGQTTDARLTGGLGLLVVGVTLLGLALGVASLLGRPGLAMAVAALAGALPLWVASLVDVVSDAALRHGTVLALSRWSGAVLLVVALVVAGMRPVVRLLWWPAAVLLAWIVQPSTTAAGYLGMSLSRGPRSPDAVREYASAAWQVWRQAIEPGARPLAPWVVAVVVAAALCWVLERRRPVPTQAAAAPAPEPGPPTVVAPTASASTIGSESSGPAWP
jgi:hypothetical protein